MTGVDFNEVLEGYHTVERFRTEDCDLGECTGYKIIELGLTVYVYDKDETLISFDRSQT